MTTLTPQQLGQRLRKGSIVLWPYRGDVEEGTVLFVNGTQVDLIWLEGYKSRNDTVELSEILALHDKAGQEHSLSVFRGNGFLTEAGVRWKAEHPTN